MFEWDEQKRRSNFEKHGVDFATVARCDWPTALIVRDERQNYGEQRFVAFLLLGIRLHVVVYAQRGAARRLISFRKANSREVGFYEAEIDRADRSRGS